MEMTRRRLLGTAAGVAAAAAAGPVLIGQGSARAAQAAPATPSVPAWPLPPGCTTNLEYSGGSGTDWTLAQDNFRDYTKSPATPGGYPWPFHVEKFFDSNPTERIVQQAANGTAYFLISIEPDPAMTQAGKTYISNFIQNVIVENNLQSKVLAFCVPSEANGSSTFTPATYGEYIRYYGPTILNAGYNIVWDGASFDPAGCEAFGKACYNNTDIIAAGCDGYLKEYVNVGGGSWSYIDPYLAWVKSVNLPLCWCEFGTSTLDPTTHPWDKCCSELASRLTSQPLAWFAYWNVADKPGSYNPVTGPNDPKIPGLVTLHDALAG